MVATNIRDMLNGPRLPAVWIRKLDPVNDYRFDREEVCCIRPYCASCGKKAQWITGRRQPNGVQANRPVCDHHARTWCKAKKLSLPDELKDDE